MSKRRKPKIAGVHLSTWCPGHGHKWHIVYTPFWLDKNLDKKSIAPRWDDGYTREFKEGLTYDTPEEANEYRRLNILKEQEEEYFFDPYKDQ